jgi:hypothetical protein
LLNKYNVDFYIFFCTDFKHSVMKRKVIESFFKPVEIRTISQSESQPNIEVHDQEHAQNHATDVQELRTGSVAYKRDPGKRL